MKILITGGAGFIGSHLTEELLKKGYSVSIIDNLSTGRMENLQSCLANDNLKFIEGDIQDEEILDKLVQDCDAVYHLAAAVGVKLIADQPVRTIETNIGGTENILDLANKYAKKILLASTSEVYGKNESVPFSEDDDLVLGSTKYSRWSYACSKAIDEFLGLAFYQEYNLPVTIARFFNTIGPRQTGEYGMVVPRFVQQALDGQPLQIFGDGRQTRCFTDVSDVVRAVTALMDCPDAVGRVFNIGSEKEISIEGLAKRILQLTGSKSEKKYVPHEEAYGRPIEDMKRRVPDISRINETTGWMPQIGLDESLKKIIEYFNR